MTQLQIELSKHPKCRVHLKVTIPASYSAKVKKEALKKINKEISLPGFRKGRAPDGYIEKNYGVHLEREWKSLLSEKALNDAIIQEKVYPLDRKRQVKADWESFNKDSENIIIFEFETSPEIATIDYTTLQIESPPKPEVSQEEIDKEIQVLLERCSEFLPTESSIEKDGWADIELTDSEGKPVSNFPQGQTQINETQFTKPVLKALVGMNTNDECSIDWKIHKTKEACSLKVKQVLTKTVPALDDALAKKFGLESKDALLQRLKANLEQAQQQEFNANLHSAIQKALTEKYTFELPASVLENEQKSIAEQKTQEFSTKNDNQSPSEDDKEKINAEALEQAEKNVRTTFLIYHIADCEKITVGEDEVKEFMAPYLQGLQNEKDPERLRHYFQSLYSRCHMQILFSKTLNTVASKLDIA